MATAVAKPRDSFECPLCSASLKPGLSTCKTCGRPVPRPLEWQAVLVFLGITLAVILSLIFYFWAWPNIKGNSAIALVRQQDGAFIEQAMATIREKQYRFLGWDTQVYSSRLVLVTFTYQDTNPGQNSYMAVWWAVDLEKGSVEKVRSMQDFADAHLLKDS